MNHFGFTRPPHCGEHSPEEDYYVGCTPANLEMRPLCATRPRPPRAAIAWCRSPGAAAIRSAWTFCPGPSRIRAQLPKLRLGWCWPRDLRPQDIEADLCHHRAYTPQRATSLAEPAQAVAVVLYEFQGGRRERGKDYAPRPRTAWPALPLPPRVLTDAGTTGGQYERSLRYLTTCC
jgi:hypothetical protein